MGMNPIWPKFEKINVWLTHLISFKKLMVALIPIVWFQMVINMCQENINNHNKKHSMPFCKCTHHSIFETWKINDIKSYLQMMVVLDLMPLNPSISSCKTRSTNGCKGFYGTFLLSCFLPPIHTKGSHTHDTHSHTHSHLLWPNKCIFLSGPKSPMGRFLARDEMDP